MNDEQTVVNNSSEMYLEDTRKKSNCLGKIMLMPSMLSECAGSNLGTQYFCTIEVEFACLTRIEK
eukprot:snap_masked-scaffold_38-processed-gene-2.83-mRNA-1 protein AED:1.00 eAED:1.00 QI:0/-1/0/0/-1/1/1/0/64